MRSFFSRHSLALRVTAVLLIVCSLTLTAAPAFLPSANAADEPVYTKKYIYKWERFYEIEDSLVKDEEYPGMLIWPSNGVYYATCGMNIGDKNRSFYGVDITHDSVLSFQHDWKKDSETSNPPPAFFYTDGERNAWHFIGTGTDSNFMTGYMYCVEIKLCDGKTYAYDDDNYLGFSTSKSTGWTLVGTGVGDFIMYSSEATYGYASFLHTRGTSTSRYFDMSGNRLTVNQYDWDELLDYDAPDFLFYLARSREEYTGIGTYTVKSGTTLQIKNNSWLDKNCTLTVEPGAVLSISGKFINNGLIENYGTVILNEGSSVSTFGERSSTGGSITNYGSQSTYKGSTPMQGEGNLIVMKNARLVLPSKDASDNITKARLKLTAGASLVNYGMVFAPCSMEISSALIQNKSTGIICSHCSIGGGEYVAMDFSWEKKDRYSITHLSNIRNDFCSAKSIIENDGDWQYYTECENAFESEYAGSGQYT